MPARAEVIVVGGGVYGLLTALGLLDRGIVPIILESRSVARGASGRNAGSLHYQIRREDEDRPWRHRMITRSMSAWSDLETQLGASLGVSQVGGLMVAQTEAEAEWLRRKTGIDAKLGLTVEFVEGRDVGRRWPWIAESIHGAVWCEDEGFVDPLLVCTTLAEVVRRRGGTIWEGWRVERLSAHAGGVTVHGAQGEMSAQKVALCTGAGLLPTLAELVDVPLRRTVYGMLVTCRAPHALEGLVQRVAGGLTVKQTSQGTVLIGGGWPGRADREGEAVPLPSSMGGNARAALDVIPGLRDLYVVRAWGGWIPQIDDSVPVLRESKVPNVFVCVIPAGAAGFTVAPIVCEDYVKLLVG